MYGAALRKDAVISTNVMTKEKTILFLITCLLYAVITESSVPVKIEMQFIIQESKVHPSFCFDGTSSPCSLASERPVVVLQRPRSMKKNRGLDSAILRELSGNAWIAKSRHILSID